MFYFPIGYLFKSYTDTKDKNHLFFYINWQIVTNPFLGFLQKDILDKGSKRNISNYF